MKWYLGDTYLICNTKPDTYIGFGTDNFNNWKHWLHCSDNDAKAYTICTSLIDILSKLHPFTHNKYLGKKYKCLINGDIIDYRGLGLEMNKSLDSITESDQGVIFNKGQWATIVEGKSNDEEWYKKLTTDDYVVSLTTLNHVREKNYVYRIVQRSNKHDYIYYKKGYVSNKFREFRLATKEEADACRAAGHPIDITSIKKSCITDIKEDCLMVKPDKKVKGTQTKSNYIQLQTLKGLL